MAEMINESKPEIVPSGFIFKVLSGPINGIEFSLGSHTYFMCVGDAAEGQGNLAQNLEYAERTLYLPTTVPGNNFIVNLSGNITGETFDVSISHPEHQETRTLTLNTICHIEGIYFAIKQEGTQWSENVLKGALPPATLNNEKEVVAAKLNSASGSKYKWVTGLVAACLLILLGAGGTVAWLKYTPDTSPAPDLSASIMQQLVGDNTGYSVQRGRDNTYYLFAQNNQQAEWAKQAATRAHSAGSWKILTPQEEELRLARVLERNNIAFFTIRFTDLLTPVLIMSSTRNATDPAALEQIKEMLLDTMPYAKKVNIELKTDKEILLMAEEGLAARGFDYQIMQSDSGVTLSSQMSAGDSRMAEFNRYVAQFYRSWGRRYVHFSVDLRDDLLKEKSFKYGQDGYVNMGKSHWLFNS